MAASKLAVYETGYEDERFEHPVGPSFHCCICTNVIKDPVMCDNEHIFCKACITRHLMYSQTCPTCMQPLTVETLKEPSRTVMNLLAELRIRCEFFSRGCGKIVQLGDLERHVADCGFAPAVCSNEGCQLQVNKQDLRFHETAVCELRRVECHSCNDVRREMVIVKSNLATLNEKLAKNEKKMQEFETRSKALVAKLNQQEEKNRLLEANNVRMNKCLKEITEQLQENTPQNEQTSSNVLVDEMKGIAEADCTDEGPKLVVAGGLGVQKEKKSIEMFDFSNKTWTPLQPMTNNHHGASSFVYNNELFIVGGYVKSIEKLSLNAVHGDQSLPWENFPVELPGRLAGHCSVVYNGRLIVIGGYDGSQRAHCNGITEISLVPPYTCKVLASMKQARWYHGVAIFGDKILIVGGRKRWRNITAHKSVVMYDITENEFDKLAPLPYSLCEMATVKWDDDSVMIMGGIDRDDEPLNKVLMYNIKTQKIQMLPDMKYKRKGCVAAVVKDTVIVMGGQDEKGNYLKSVESFRFDKYSWEELPEMLQARGLATAVVC